MCLHENFLTLLYIKGMGIIQVISLMVAAPVTRILGYLQPPASYVSF